MNKGSIIQVNDDSGSATFVLVDELNPQLHAVARLRMHEQFIQISLDVHPLVAPTEVRRLYQHVRDNHYGTPRRHRHSTRPLGILMQFISEGGAATWRERRQAWNQKYPKHRYGHVPQMLYDYKKARRLAVDGAL